MTRIASHRGGTLEYGDSTPCGFSATALMRLEEVEFDVHPTADGGIVVHHDPTLEGTTDRSGVIVDLTLDKVKAATINYSAGGHPLTLEELCALYVQSEVDFRCEIKSGVDGRPYTDFVPKVIKTLSQNGMLERTVFSSFLIHALDHLAAATDRPRLWLISPPVLRQVGIESVIELCNTHRIPEVGVHIDTADAMLARAVQAAGLHFGCWAAHLPEQIDKALALGVKVFTTDRPTLAIAMRNRFRQTEVVA
ncbi:glycerophosphodiester phosphodiesterase family protein [Agrobacterium vitis]|uniref:glycerophosphodiester phosphodiesterase family protein n=1 Tax=Agrobacterium vitis TaxID=373 RepID=UPI001572E823|nr:glycerophosphodiester phosphodiesterase family protein [Agrobacterium vitis]NSZ19912.1 glycerophosphodiester phosphodiesterase [Agrobacterium vitis]QZO07604.1 glycerophosphodiester phosphodiesterase [Agrobacterium vitis]UJL90798.1 glycerophosphodiester phosphodiesterase [Agrobacterium vitis]